MSGSGVEFGGCPESGIQPSGPRLAHSGDLFEGFGVTVQIYKKPTGVRDIGGLECFLELINRGRSLFLKYRLSNRNVEAGASGHLSKIGIRDSSTSTLPSNQ
jgi:hypothetical protein